MPLHNFIPHEKVLDVQVDEGQFYIDPDEINEGELFQDETTQLTLTPAAVASDTESLEHKNPEEIITPIEPAVPQLPATDDSLHTIPHLRTHTTTML